MSGGESITLAQLSAFKRQLQEGRSLSLEQQRQLIQQLENNVDRLVTARERFDRLAQMESDGSQLGKDLLVGLVELGASLGVERG